MTTNIEGQFFKVFEIEPKYYNTCTLEDKYWNNEELANLYGTFDYYLQNECPHYCEGYYSTCEYAYERITFPQITSGILLELIFILNKLEITNGVNLFDDNFKDLKYRILRKSITIQKNEFLKNDIREKHKSQVQSLFTEVGK